MKNYLFKNTEAKYRSESFGGLVSINNQLYILSKEDYKLLNKIDKKKCILESEITKSEQRSLKKLLRKMITAEQQPRMMLKLLLQP